MFDLQLKQLRKDHGLKQTELAELVGVSSRVISAWERGETQITLEDACRVSDAIGCTPNDLCGWWSTHERPDDTAALSLEESALVESYRDCTAEQRRAVLITAENAAGASKKKPESAPLRAERSA